jgi:hypothetical protein
MNKLKNPFSFKAYDEKLDKNNAANYIPPHKRKLMKEYLSGSNITLKEGNTGFEKISSYR